LWIFINNYFLFFKISDIANAIELTALGYSISEDAQFYSSLIDKFNKYSKSNNLDIEVKLFFLSSVNVTGNMGDYVSFLGTLFRKKDKRYDIYFYENEYIVDYDKYLMDLNEVISKEHLNMFDSEIIQEVCTKNGALIGLVIWV